MGGNDSGPATPTPSPRLRLGCERARQCRGFPSRARVPARGGERDRLGREGISPSRPGPSSGAHAGPALGRAVGRPPRPAHHPPEGSSAAPWTEQPLCPRPTSRGRQKSAGPWAKCLWTEPSPFDFNSRFYTERAGVPVVPRVLPPAGRGPRGAWVSEAAPWLRLGTVRWAASPYISGPLDRAARAWRIHQPALAGRAPPVCAEALRGPGQRLA